MKINNMFIPICTNPAKYDISVMRTTTKQWRLNRMYPADHDLAVSTEVDGE